MLISHVNLFIKCKEKIIFTTDQAMLNTDRIYSIMHLFFVLLISLFFALPANAQSEGHKAYRFTLNDEIGPAAWRITERAFAEAASYGAESIVIEMNTYGGMVNFADSIRTRILNSPVKTIVFINHNAASAGTLIALASDAIYMVKGASIGAASVVNEGGEVLPEKYQSYMRSLMRATAEAKGRDPKIAEAFVDPDVVLPGIKEAGKVLTLTTKEAVDLGIAKSEASSIATVLQMEDIDLSQVKHYESTWSDKLINVLINPAVSGILILLIMGGIYFEMQTPGIGFALVVAIIAAILFFAPLYIQGLADNWEIALFVVGVILLLLEIFVIPGFGVAGILGLIAVISGLAFSMVPNDFFDFVPTQPNNLFNAFVIVIASTIASIVLCVIFGKSILKSNAFRRLVLADEQQAEFGYVSSLKEKDLTNKEGVAITTLRPSGKVEIESKWYDAVALDGFIEKDTLVYVERQENYQVFVRKKKDIPAY